MFVIFFLSVLSCHSAAGGGQGMHVVVHATNFLREYESQIREELCAEGRTLLSPMIPCFTQYAALLMQDDITDTGGPFGLGEQLGLALEFATGIGDALLVSQLQGGKLAIDLLESMACVQTMTQKCFCDGANWATRRPSNQQLAVVHTMRSRHGALDKFLPSMPPATSLHVDALDHTFDWPRLAPLAKAKMHTLEAPFTKSWTATLSDLSASISAVCPAWQLCEDYILSSPVACEAFIAMPHKHWSKLEQLATSLDAIIAVVMGVRHGPPLVKPEVISEAKRVLELCVKTSVYRAVVHAVFEDLPAKESIAEAQVVVKALRRAAGTANVTLPVDMDAELTKWESGERTAHDAAPAKAPKVSPPGDPPSAPVVPSASQSESRLVLASQSEPAGSLAERVAKAKRTGGSLAERASRAKRPR